MHKNNGYVVRTREDPIDTPIADISSIITVSSWLLPSDNWLPNTGAGGGTFAQKKCFFQQPHVPTAEESTLFPTLHICVHTQEMFGQTLADNSRPDGGGSRTLHLVSMTKDRIWDNSGSLQQQDEKEEREEEEHRQGLSKARSCFPFPGEQRIFL